MAKRAGTRSARAPLSRERILREAVALADERGLEALSMRRLGQRLGVEAMSLYNHVASKDDLEAGIVERVLGEIEPPDGPDWKEALRRTSIASYEAFLRHRWACGLMLRVSRPSAVRMEWMEAVLRTLREEGFSADLTHHAYHALDSHIVGFTLWQVSMPFETREELVDLASGFLEHLDATRFPYTVEHAEQHIAPPPPGAKPEFEFGLELILDGLERLRDAGRPPGVVRPRRSVS
jgi:AcrR family transcriptional regulator